MIKKIYDRDTGNIYDVGADNKLKLVAEGTLEIEGYGYKPIYNFEANKCYLIQIFENEVSFISVQLWIDDNYRGFAITNDYSNAGELVYVTIGNTFFEVYTLREGSYVQDYEGYLYKIYELPFSM